MAIKATTLITLTRVNDGKGIKSTSVTYQIWSNGTSTPTGTWSSTPPKTTADKPYLWTRTVITYSDNTQSTSYSVGSTPEGIQVGGRNLAKKTSDEWSDWIDIPKLNQENATVYFNTIDMPDCKLEDMFTSYYEIEYMDVKQSENIPDGGKSRVCSNCCSIVDGKKVWISPTCHWSHPPVNGVKVYTGTSTITEQFLKIEKILINIRFDYVASGKLRIRKVKYEKGNKATDWTPAPEDVDEAINTERTERQSAIETKANEITSKVSETYVSNSAFEHYQNTVSTQFTQTKKDFTWSINQSVTDAKNGMSGQIDSVNGRLDGLKQTTDNVNSYMSFDNDALTLGKSDSAFKTKITNQEWSIQKNGAKVTYINDQTMYITDGQFTQSLKIGAFGFVPRANGSLDFKKVG